jgi:hypothetical protein
MLQHMYSFLQHKFGLKQLVIEHATAILKATHLLRYEDNDVMVFYHILRNSIDEDFRKVARIPVLPPAP